MLIDSTDLTTQIYTGTTKFFVNSIGSTSTANKYFYTDTASSLYTLSSVDHSQLEMNNIPYKNPRGIRMARTSNQFTFITDARMVGLAEYSGAFITYRYIPTPY